MDMTRIKLIIFDGDGTLVTTKSGATFRKSADDWQVLPGRKERLAELQAAGIKTAIATNQGGVAFGYLDRDEMMLQLMVLTIELGLEGNCVCFNHPNGKIEQYRKDDYDRKPHPGMLFKTMAHHFVYAHETLFVGDRPEDEQAARNAGIAFMWSDEFFV